MLAASLLTRSLSFHTCTSHAVHRAVRFPSFDLVRGPCYMSLGEGTEEMGRTRQYAIRVNVIKRIKIGKRCPFAAVVERNGKMVRDHVWVSGRDEHHPEGHYHIEWY